MYKCWSYDAKFEMSPPVFVRELFIESYLNVIICFRYIPECNPSFGISVCSKKLRICLLVIHNLLPNWPIFAHGSHAKTAKLSLFVQLFRVCRVWGDCVLWRNFAPSTTKFIKSGNLDYDVKCTFTCLIVQMVFLIMTS